MRLADVAERLECELEGDPQLEITGVAGLGEAEPGQLTFFVNPRYRAAIKTSRASAIIVARDAGPMPMPTLRTENPYFAFARAIELFHPAPQYAPGIHPTAVVASSARLGPGTHVGPYCFIDEDVVIGRNAVLHSFVTIYRGAHIGDDFFAHSHAMVRERCRIGHRVTLQNGVVVGSDGFGFAKQADGRWHKMRQAGIAVVEDDVEIQANSCVDRATVGSSRIGRGAKLDNLVHVGHASKVGEGTLLCAQVGLAGSTVVGDECMLGGQVGIAGHLTIGDRVLLTAQSGVPHDLAGGVRYSGAPAIEHSRWMKSVAVYNHLPELQKTVRELRAEVAPLTRKKKKGKRKK